MKTTPEFEISTPASTAEIAEATQNLWRIYGVTNDWIKSADTKAAAILSANAILAGAAVNSFNVINGFSKVFLQHHHSVLVLATLALLLMVGAVVSCLRCIFPNLGSGPATSLIYFGHIAQRQSAREYEADVLRTLNEPLGAFREIAAQVYINSRIATRKSGAVAWAVRSFSAALLFVLLAALAAKLA